MAVYDRTRVRLDSRFLKTLTEASIRLEKDLDPNTIPLALNHLTKLILDTCGGSISSNLFDYYPNPITKPTIEFDPKKPSQFAGIDIPASFALDIVTKVGHRPDINIEEDLIEEVARFYGYNKIPTNEPLEAKTVPEITPKNLYLIESLKDKLTALGYDEIRSWPLVQTPTDKATAIYTQNSINSEYPVLRQSLIQSLQTQLDQYNRYKLPNPQFFEIGKIFYQQNGQYIEKFALGLYHHDLDRLCRDARSCVSTDSWNISGNFAEIVLDDLPLLETYQPQNLINSAYELTSQIITLDANVNLDSPHDPLELIKEYAAKIDPKVLWSIQIVDVYNSRYTFRVSYFNTDDKTAKKIHLSAFGLK
jgi:phenylalanyl-tRNA synthetase beta subunit